MWERYVGELLTREGFRVEVPVKECRPTIAERDGYGDDGDVFVFTESGKRVTLSVKSSSLVFRKPLDFPLAWTIVDTVKAWVRRPCSAVVWVSTKTRGIIVIPASTREHWRETRWATVDGVKPAYQCPRLLCRTWKEMVEWLKTI